MIWAFQATFYMLYKNNTIVINLSSHCFQKPDFASADPSSLFPLVNEKLLPVDKDSAI